MDVSIGIMAFNEEGNITKLLEAILSKELKKVKIKEIIVISDGSTNKTNKIPRIHPKRYINLVNHSRKKVNGFWTRKPAISFKRRRT